MTELDRRTQWDFANLDELMAAQRQGRSTEIIASVVEPTLIQIVIEPIQSLVATAQSTQSQAEVTIPAIADELPIDAASAQARDVVEEVADVTVQETRRVKTKQKATPGQEVESSFAAEQLTIEAATVPVDESETTTGEIGTSTTENIASDTTLVQAPAVTASATGVEEQLVGAIVPPAQLDQNTRQGTTVVSEGEDLEALLLAVTADTRTDVANVPPVVDDHEETGTEQPVNLGSNTQQHVDVAELIDVSTEPTGSAA